MSRLWFALEAAGLGLCWALVCWRVIVAYVHGLPTPPPQDEDEGW